jgi:hypothetical protein
MRSSSHLRYGSQAILSAIMSRTFHLPIGWTTLGVLGLAVTVATAAHEMGHHLVAAIECGGFGRVTFTRFQERDGCRAIIGNISGPTISLLILWLGAVLLRNPRSALRGFVAVISAMPLVRVASVASGGDDWNYSARIVTGDRHIVLLTWIVVLIVLPPLVLAYRGLDNRHRWLVFALALILSVFPAAILQPLDVRVYFTWIDHREAFRQPTMLGIPLVVLAVYGAATFVFFRWAYPWLRKHESVTGAN